ncbi:hypothetical protein O7627_33495 [Solwaraspora sp. WMMD1047]|uniref:hypothetical protein n=1 Tax=Solwaraspora sp. WMMD1047 TaxID=3016102 RepID=UPI0024170D4D|nr:hypothetical protein [Solwaraspora sp. WMMD1047]MDG4834182.1 hypothetical protein [Solwaraspora sp. WMMD1047]
MPGQVSPGVVDCEPAGRQVRQRAGDQIRVDLLDDCVLAVLGFGLHEDERAVGEYRVVSVAGQEFLLAAGLAGWSRRTISRAVTAYRVPANAV